MGNIIVCDQLFEISAPVLSWRDENGKSFYPYPKSFSKRDLSLPDLQKQINSIIIHHSQTFSAVNTFNVLVSRGLSVTFIIDDDNIDGVSTIYQCLDVKEAAYSNKPLNFSAVGIEVSYMAFRDKSYYKDGRHEESEDFIRGAKIQGYIPSPAQVKATAILCQGLKKAFPSLSLKFPRDEEGNIIKSKIKDPKGLLNHYNISDDKIDPLCFSHDDFEDIIEGNEIYDQL